MYAVVPFPIPCRKSLNKVRSLVGLETRIIKIISLPPTLISPYFPQVDTLKKKLLENVDGVLAVHEFHVWQLTGERIIASAHIRCFNLTEYMKVGFFKNK